MKQQMTAETLTEKLIEVVLNGKTVPGTNNWEREDAEYLLEIAPELTDSDLGDVIGTKAVPIFRQMQAIIADRS